MIICIILLYDHVPLTAPGAPPETFTTQSTVISTITLSWTPPPMDRQYGEIIEYFITYRITPNGAISERTVNSLGANLTGLLSATEYIITITAVNNIGRSPFIETRSQITIDDGKFDN